MKSTRKWLALLLAGVMVVGIVGCSDDTAWYLTETDDEDENQITLKDDNADDLNDKDDDHSVTTTEKKESEFPNEGDDVVGNDDGWTIIEEPSCTQSGVKTRINSITGENETQRISANGHSMDNGKCIHCGVAESQGLDFQMSGNDNYSVVGIGSCTDTDIVIPEKYNDKNVIGVEASALGSPSITSVYIPESVRFIGAGAFASSKELLYVFIPDSVTVIDSGAFGNCTSLASIVIPDSVTDLSDYMFSGCTSLSEVTLPSNLKSIGMYAFSGTALTGIEFPNSLESISDNAFAVCSSLTSIDLPKGITDINWGTFMECPALTSVAIPDSVKSIGPYAFSECGSLSSISLPDSVISVGEHAFSECVSISSVVIPGSVAEIGEGAFSQCLALENVDISQGVTDIGESAFSECTNLVNLAIPDSVTKIGNNAFLNCKAIVSVTIPDSVTSIGDNAFRGCTSLTNVTLPVRLSNIGNDAFYGCTGYVLTKLSESEQELISLLMSQSDIWETHQDSETMKYSRVDVAEVNGVQFYYNGETLFFMPNYTMEGTAYTSRILYAIGENNYIQLSSDSRLDKYTFYDEVCIVGDLYDRNSSIDEKTYILADLYLQYKDLRADLFADYGDIAQFDQSKLDESKKLLYDSFFETEDNWSKLGISWGVYANCMQFKIWDSGEGNFEIICRYGTESFSNFYVKSYSINQKFGTIEVNELSDSEEERLEHDLSTQSWCKWKVTWSNEKKGNVIGNYLLNMK